MEKRPLRVLFLPVDDGGCGWYRIRMWHKMFKKMDNVESLIIETKDKPSEKQQHEAIANADVVVARLSGIPYIRVIKEDIDPHKPIVFDHDDNTMEILPSSEHYRDFGTQDAYAYIEGTAKPIWVTGEGDFNRFKNLWNQMTLIYALGSADLITAPVQSLVDFYMQYGSKETKGVVLPNSLDFNMWPEGKFKWDKRPENEIRIGWQGGVSHLADWNEIGKTMGNVLKDYPEVTVHIMGSYFDNQFKSFEDRITFYDWVPFEGYPARLATLGLDAAIIPLEDKPFNRFKSEVKFTEFSKMGVPVLVKDIPPYSEVCKNKYTAYTYKDNEEFEVRLREMLDDLKGSKEMANKVVKNAQRWVKKERNAVETAKKVVEAYKSILPEEVQEELL